MSAAEFSFMISQLLASLPPHKAGLIIEHNPHKNYYETVDQWDADRMKDWIDDHDERRKAVEADEVWTIQWYPNTPIGSHSCAAASLEALLRHVQGFGKEAQA